MSGFEGLKGLSYARAVAKQMGKPETSIFDDMKLRGFEGATIDEKSRIYIPSVVYHPVKEKWNSDTFYACKWRVRDKTPEGGLKLHHILRLYPYNPFDPHNDPSYTRCRISTDKNNNRRISLKEEQRFHLGEDKGSLMVWNGMLEYAELWGFKSWKEYWEGLIRDICNEEDRPDAHKLMIDSIMNSHGRNKEVA